MNKKNILILISCCLAAIMLCAADWDKPTTTSNYSTEVLPELKGRDESGATMDYSSDSNLPDGLIRFNRTTNRFQEYDSVTTTWTDIDINDPHESLTNNPHNVTAAQAGAASSGALTAHTSNTSNPHSVTAAQAGALAISNNLSDVASASTALTNLGGASSADLSSHTSNTSNPHSVTAAQVGAMVGSNNLSDISSASTARTNLTAAKSGVNSDITTLNACSEVSVTGNLTLKSDYVGGYVLIAPGTGTTYGWKIVSTGKWEPPASMQDSYTLWTGWPTCTNCARTFSLDPNAATAVDNANAINTLWETLQDMGLLQ